MEAVLTVRLDADVKKRGTEVMNASGLTPSQAVRKLFQYAVTHDALPFEPEGRLTPQQKLERIRAFDRCHTKEPLDLTDDELRAERLESRYAHHA